MVAPRRRRGGRAVLAVAAVAAAAVLAYAAAMSGGGAEAPEVQALRDMIAALDLLVIEYREAVRDGRVLLESEYTAALEIVGRIIETYEAHRQGLEAIDAGLASRLGEVLDELRRAVESVENPETVEGLAAEAIEVASALIAKAG